MSHNIASPVQGLAHQRRSVSSHTTTFPSNVASSTRFTPTVTPHAHELSRKVVNQQQHQQPARAPPGVKVKPVPFPYPADGLRLSDLSSMGRHSSLPAKRVAGMLSPRDSVSESSQETKHVSHGMSTPEPLNKQHTPANLSTPRKMPQQSCNVNTGSPRGIGTDLEQESKEMTQKGMLKTSLATPAFSKKLSFGGDVQKVVVDAKKESVNTEGETKLGPQKAKVSWGTVAAGGAGGAVVAGTGGALTGMGVGAACGVPLALFTFGLSIPIAAGIGGVVGSVSGGAAGFAGGSAAGYLAGARVQKSTKSHTDTGGLDQEFPSQAMGC